MENDNNITDLTNNCNEPDLNRHFLDKLFGQIKLGSIRESIFNLVILSLGSGCLSLPKYRGKTSLLLGLIMVVIIGLLVWWALILISKVCASKIFMFILI